MSSQTFDFSIKPAHRKSPQGLCCTGSQVSWEGGGARGGCTCPNSISPTIDKPKFNVQLNSHQTTSPPPLPEPASSRGQLAKWCLCISPGKSCLMLPFLRAELEMLLVAQHDGSKSSSALFHKQEMVLPGRASCTCGWPGRRKVCRGCLWLLSQAQTPGWLRSCPPQPVLGGLAPPAGSPAPGWVAQPQWETRGWGRLNDALGQWGEGPRQGEAEGHPHPRTSLCSGPPRPHGPPMTMDMALSRSLVEWREASAIGRAARVPAACAWDEGWVHTVY